jgi:DoxX-like family
MTKRNKIIYWAATIWLALGMTVTGAGQLIKMKAGAGGTDSVTHLGYPVYILTILGVWKLLGVVTVLMPRFPLLKEWAYAGFFFLMTGALFSHFAVGHAAAEFFGPGLLLILTGVSWYFRPAERKVAFSESRKEKYEQCEDHKREVVA